MTDHPDGPAAISLPAKAELRRAALARRDGLAPERRAALSARLVDHLDDLGLCCGKMVAGFWPIRSEIDPRPLMAALAARGLSLALPVVLDDRETMIFRRHVPGGPLVASSFGLSVPPSQADEVIPDALLVPLAAFDRAGHRIGYGKGHYDRALARIEADGPKLKIGLAFAIQEVARVPDEGHDRRLDLILTEDGPIVPLGDPT